MANPENEALVRQVTQLLSEPELPPDFDQFIDPNWDNHAPGTLWSQGPQGFKALHDSFHEGFTDYGIIVDRLVSDGDYVAVRYRMHGTHTGEFMGIPPTGRAVDVPGISIHRFENGRLAESWVMPDRLELMEQLGVIQATGQPRQRAA